MGSFDFNNYLNEFANSLLRDSLLDKLDPVLKQEMFDAGVDLIIDFNDQSYKIIGLNDELDQKIINDLKSKK